MTQCVAAILNYKWNIMVKMKINHTLIQMFNELLPDPRNRIRGCKRNQILAQKVIIVVCYMPTILESYVKMTSNQ